MQLISSNSDLPSVHNDPWANPSDQFVVWSDVPLSWVTKLSYKIHHGVYNRTLNSFHTDILFFLFPRGSSLFTQDFLVDTLPFISISSLFLDILWPSCLGLLQHNINRYPTLWQQHPLVLYIWTLVTCNPWWVPFLRTVHSFLQHLSGSESIDYL